MPARFVTILVLVATSTAAAVLKWRNDGAGWGALVGIVVGAALGLEVVLLPVLPRRTPLPDDRLATFLGVMVFFTSYCVGLGVVAAGMVDSVFRESPVALSRALEMFPFGVLVVGLYGALFALPAIAVVVVSLEWLCKAES